MSTSSLQKNAMKTVERALAMLGEAQEALRLANRFGEQPHSGTILVFDRVFGTRNEALESRGLNFDPAMLVPNLSQSRIDDLGRALGAGVDLIVIDEVADVVSPSYRHVAIRIGDTWFTTSARKAKMSWEQLVEFIGDSRCWEVADMREIPVDAPQVIEAAPIESEGAMSAADGLEANRKAAMELLRKMRSNGKNPTPKQIVDALTGMLKGEGESE